MASNNRNIVTLLRNHFDEEELRDLVYDLDFDFEDLPASMGKSGKVLELVRIFEKNGCLTELVNVAKEYRPNSDWPDTEQPFSSSDLYGESEKPYLPYEPPKEGMILIESGTFLMGRNGESPSYEQPEHEVDLPAFYLCKTPVTNAQYAEFVKVTKKHKPEKVGWFGLKPPSKKLDHPVVGICWDDAVTYCEWLQEKSGRPYRLPTEAEWEKAARGTDGRLYPWGNEWDENRCHFNARGTTAVDAHPDGESPYGCSDMIGNASEWTNTLWGNDPSTSSYPYPYQLKDGREDAQLEGTIYRIFRGSAFDEDKPERMRCTTRQWYVPNNKDKRRGFRLALSHF